MVTWREQVGRDSWKNLIAEESRIGSKVSIALPDVQASADALLTGPPSDSGLAQFCLQSNPASPAGASWLVFHAGRHFLVGAPIEAVARVQKYRNEVGIRHLNVVLLSWLPEHWAGIGGLEMEFTIWTSRWIWEECCKACKAQSRWRNLEICALENTPIAPILDPDDPRGAATLPKVRVFEELLDVTFTLGVQLRMLYTLSAETPGLCAEFSCAGSRIVIDPLRSIRDSGVANGEPSTLSVQMDRFAAIWPELSRETAKRKEQIRDLPEHSGTGDAGEWSVAPIGDLDLSVRGATLGEIRLQRPSSKPDSPIVEPQPPHQCGSQPEPTVGVIILCGALLRRERAELIDPGRVLRIRAGNHTLILSILEWRLRQIQALFGPKTKIYLKISPDTKPIVERILARLDSQVPIDNVELISSWIAPLYTGKDDCPLQPVKTNDGGWILTLGGHLTGLQSLKGKSELPEMLVVIAHNNLGRILDETTRAEATAAYAASEPVTFEVFDMEDGPIQDDRWKSFSYLKNGYLWKPEYDGGEVKPKAQFSSMTCYFKSTELLEVAGLDWRLPENGEKLAYRHGWVVRTTIRGDGQPVYSIRRDIDLVTHGSRGVRYVKFSGGGKGTYAYPRFFSVRREDHLRDLKFWDAFNEANAAGLASGMNRGIIEDEVKERKLWELVPVEKRYVWGGTRIAKMKGDPHYWTHSIAETWELSTHESGTASCLLDIRRTIPFSEVFRTSTGVSDCPFMAKYLDCAERLSIQVHPNDQVAQYLAEKGELKVSDKRGKEETFYVVEPAAERSFHLFLGFNEERLEPLAALIRPELHRMWHEVSGSQPYPVNESMHVDASSKLVGHPPSSGISADVIEQCPQQIGQVFDSIYPKILAAMRLAGEVVVTAIGRSAEHKQCILADGVSSQLLRTFTAEWTADATQPRGFHDLLKWHLVEHPRRDHSEGLPSSLLGREYLFAAIVVVRIVEELALYCRTVPSVYREMSRLFDYTCPPSDRDPTVQSLNHPLFQYFHAVPMRRGSWGRVPPGTVHAWQDGGNSLIELADNSDNTFRILDFGRELKSDTLRDMHYMQAMYALTDESIFPRSAVGRLVLPRQNRPQSEERTPFWQPLHAHLEHMEMHGGDQRHPIDANEYAAVLNPEGTAELSCGADLLRVPPASAVFVAKAAGITVRPDRDGVAIAVRPRKPPRSVVCVSFGARRVELAVWDATRSPSMRWRRLTLAGEPDHPRDVVESLRQLAGKLELDAGAVKVGICWPGPVSSGTSRCYSAAFRAHDFGVDEVREAVMDGLGIHGNADSPLLVNDAFLSAYGERRHPVGG